MSTTKRTLPTRTASGLAVAAMAVMAVMSLAACGDASEASGGSGSAEAETTSLRVATAPIQFEMVHLAENEGIFDKHGLDVEIVNGADPAALLAQVVSGDVDMATGSWINVATSVAQGVPVQVFASNGMVSDKTDNSGVLVPKDSGITSLAGLEGKTIGVVGVNTGGDIPVLQALEGAGVDVDKVKEVAIPYSGMQAALEQGTVDAVVPADSYYHQMLDAGFESISNPVREYQANMPVTVWTARTDWLAENGEDAKKFTEAMDEAIAMYEDPANLDRVKEMHAKVNQIDPSAAPETYVPADVTVNVAEAQAGIDAMAHFGLMPESISVDEVLWSEAPRRDSADADAE